MSSTQRILWRHFTSGRLNLLLAAIIIATASLAAISLVAGAVHNTIMSQARHSLAADAQIRGTTPPPSQWQVLAEQKGIRHAEATQFQAMVFAGEHNILASVRGVSSDYPLLGEVSLADSPYGESYDVTSGPPPGEAWLSPRMFAALNIAPGDPIEIGNHRLMASKSLIREPDSLQSAFNAAPRALIHASDVAATGAIQLGSRVRYALMLAGPQNALTELKSAIDLGAEFNWRTIENSNERLATTLDKATQFIRLGGVLSIILAAIGIALATRSYAGEQVTQVALLKTLGATPQKILKLYATHIVIIGATATTVGLVLGVVLYQLIQLSIRSLLTELAAPNLTDLYFAAALSFSVFVLFAAPYFLYLRSISPLRVLQQSHSSELLNNRLSLLLGAVAAFSLCAVFSGNLSLTAYVFAGLFVCALLAILCSIVIIRVAAATTRCAGPTLKLGIDSLVRHKVHTAPQIMMFSMLFMLIFTLIMVRTSLLEAWQAQLPEDAPNHYIYNIFDSEKAEVLDTLAQYDIQLQPMYPIFGGRLHEVKGSPAINAIDQAENDVNYTREFGLTWSTDLGDDNRIVAGQWWTGGNNELQLSVEQDFAAGLGLNIGDTLTLSIGGSQVQAPVTSIRSVQWDSMNLNFYLIFNKPPVNQLNANWATSFYIDEQQKDVVNKLARAHPTISIIELDQTIRQVKDIISRVSLSIELITLLVLASGVVILLASLQSTYQTRLQEGAIMRSFGASKRLVQRLNLIEFGAIGLAAGLLATLGAEAALWFIGSRILATELLLHWPLWLLGPALVTGVIVLLTANFTKQLQKQSPMKVLKNL